MFMFRSRKTALVKRAWKSRKVGLGDASHQETSQQEAAAQQLKVAAFHLLRRLTEPQLELLVAALDSGGGDPGECVLVPREVGVECVGGRSLPPHLLMVWVWRWPDLLSACQYSATPLQRLPSCAARNDHVYVCANPYHWARLLQTESPPPPYSRFSSDLLRPEDDAPSEDGDSILESQETGGTNQFATYASHGTGSVPWCQVAYWEGRERVGRLYPVCSSSLNIMGDTPHGDGLSLASLAAHSPTSPSDQVKRTREKIGLGLVLYQDGDRVWVYNRAEVPLFVTSPTLDGGLHVRSHFIVHKLPPGHIITIFDYKKARLYQKRPIHPDLLHEGPIDQNAVRVSFAKGWGPNYHRQEITECPCWLEILLVPAR